MFLLLIVAVGWSLAHPAQAQIYVQEGASGTGSLASPYGSLQDALSDLSSPEIRVAEGTYFATAGTDETVSFVLPDGVQILGGWSPDFATRDPDIYETILSGDIDGDGTPTGNTFQILRVDAPVSSLTLVEGVTVEGGNAGDVDGNQNGGGGLIVNAGTPVFRDITFRNNAATLGGGAVLCDASAPTFEDVAFEQNGGGALVAGALLAVDCAVNVTGSSFSGNTAQSGAAVYSLSGQVTLSGVTFTQNAATVGGGAIYNDSGTVTVTGGVFDRNTAAGFLGGGAIYDVGGTGRIGNAVFAGNETSTGPGGAVAVGSAGAYDMYNAAFTGNAASSADGGAVFLSGATLDAVHITTTGHSALEGQVLFADETSTATLENVILWNEPPSVTAGPGTVQFGAALIDGGLPAGATLLAGAPAVRTGDPQFVDADGPDNTAGTVDDNLRVDPLSDAVDRGLISALPADTDDLDGDADTAEPLPVDLDDTPRVEDSSIRDAGNGGPDLGAYEAASTLVVRGTADSPVEDGDIGDDAGWRMMAVPAAATVGDIADDIVFGPLGLSGEQPTAMIYQWNDAAPNDTSSFSGDWNGLTSLADPLPSGEGFILYFFDDSLDPIRPASPLVFDVPGTRIASDVEVTGLSTTALFHFLGNPYARSYDIDALSIGGTSGFQAFVSVWDPATGAYQRIEQGTPGNGISPWQGFFIERSSGSTTPNVTISASGRSTGSEFVGKATRQVITRIGLELATMKEDVPQVADDRLEVSFRPSAEAGWDVWDGTNPGGIFSARPQIVVPGDRDAVQVQKIHESQPLPLQGRVRLPLQIVRAGWEGAMQVRASTWTNVPDGWTVEIVDTRGTPTPRDDVRVRLGPDGDAFQVEPIRDATKQFASRARITGPTRYSQTGSGRGASASAAEAKGTRRFDDDSSLYLVVTPATPRARRPAPEVRRFARRALLRWTQSSNDAGVVVEHSVDGGAWSAAGTPAAEPGRGATWTSDDLPPGEHRFRLRFGSGAEAAYTESALLRMEMEADVEVRPLSPNPVRSRGSLQVAVRERQNVSVTVYDMLGRRLASLHDGPLDAGRMRVISVDAAQLQLKSGAYLIRISGESFAETHRFTVVR